MRSLAVGLENNDVFDRWGTWLALTEISAVGDPAGNVTAEAYYVRTPVARALADLGTEAASEALVHATRRADGFVRTAAIHYLSRAAGSKAIDALIELVARSGG